MAPTPNIDNRDTQSTTDLLRTSLPSPHNQPIYTDWGAYEKVVLTNGIVAHLSHFPRSQTISVSINVKVGAIDEFPHQAGYAHLLEHMILDTTSPLGEAFGKIPKDGTGQEGFINGLTSLTGTSYSFRFPTNLADGILDKIGEQIRNPTISEESLAREKKVVYAEMREMSRNATTNFHHLMRAIHPHAGISHPILGLPMTIRETSIEKLTNFRNEYYFADALTVFITGDLSGGKKLQVIDAFSSIRERREQVHERITSSIWEDKAAPRYKIIPKTEIRPNIDLMIAFPNPDFDHPDSVITPLVHELFQGLSGGPLITRLRHDSGLAYSPELRSSPSIQPSNLSILNVKVSSSRQIRRIYDALNRAICDMTDSLIAEENVAHAAELVSRRAYTYDFGFHDNITQADRMGGPVILPEVMKEMIKCVRPDDIQRVAQHIFSDAFVLIRGNVFPFRNFSFFAR